MNKPVNVDLYMASFPEDVQAILQSVRKTIQHAAPVAEESISYAMPAYSLHGKPLVYFAGYKNHIGFYATPSGHEAFDKALSKYKMGKGSVQFPINEPMPLTLIAKMVQYRLKEVEAKLQEKKPKQR